MARAYNFSAGPATLPVEVIERAQKDLVDYKGAGMSVMEMSHRSPEYTAIFNTAMENLGKLMNIPSNYRILFLQGGASSQFAMVPLNLYSEKRKADYINTGAWSKKAIAEAKRYGSVRVVASSDDKNFSYIPDITRDMFDPDADFVHITTNNTIYGTVFPEIPDTGSVPVVADMSSNILGQVYDVSRFGLIYAGAQKNIGPAGLAVVIIREDLMGSALDITPIMLITRCMQMALPCSIRHHVLRSIWLDWYSNGCLILVGWRQWRKSTGAKAGMLYEFLDNSDLFHSTVEPGSRSIMNVPFVTRNDELDKQFIAEAAARNLKTLKGHRTVGGMRASIYNAMPVEGVKKLVEFMKEFEMSVK